MTRYLIVSATRAEAAYVPEGLPLVITGVGKTAAATAVTRALMEIERDDLMVLNIGTAGALRPEREGLFVPGRVINHDISAAALRAFDYDPREELAVGDGGLATDDSVLASGDTFVADPLVRDQLAERADLVDMEGYAVAYACDALGVPVHLIKHVSDSADADAMDWPDLVDASAQVLGAYLADLVAQS
ncbi:nucleosidase [Ornithinimicrobium ciconiae]|uniref:nucleosidase n=1 Tax=Ornithinimicrobium ciconiae TaxID=2594265 RepID=UPI001D180297|nr:nucleosidase [Ornithinimicrobium ciconiae]